MATLRILIADDHKLFSDGIGRLLNAETGWEVVGPANDGVTAVVEAARLRPDVVLMDISMPGMSSFQACQEIRQERRDVKIVFVSMYDDDDYLRQAMESGASGYVLKGSPGPELVAAVREVANGGTYVNPRMLAKLVDDYRGRNRGTGGGSQLGSLTTRELEMLKLLAEGQSVKEIATSLGLSIKTVEAHKFNLMRKLDIHNKAQLVQYAIQKKIIHLQPRPDEDMLEG